MLALLRLADQLLERFGRGVEALFDGRGLCPQLLVELLELLLDRLDGFLRAADVLRLLERPTHAARRRRRAPERRGADRLASHERAEQRRAERDRRLQRLRLGLLRLSVNGLLGAAQSLLRRRHLRRVLLTQLLDHLRPASRASRAAGES